MTISFDLSDKVEGLLGVWGRIIKFFRLRTHVSFKGKIAFFHKGILQGNPTSPGIFLISMYLLFRQASVLALCYLDDLALVHQRGQLHITIEECRNLGEKGGLKINLSKCASSADGLFRYLGVTYRKGDDRWFPEALEEAIQSQLTALARLRSILSIQKLVWLFDTLVISSTRYRTMRRQEVKCILVASLIDLLICGGSKYVEDKSYWALLARGYLDNKYDKEQAKRKRIVRVMARLTRLYGFTCKRCKRAGTGLTLSHAATVHKREFRLLILGYVEHGGALYWNYLEGRLSALTRSSEEII